MIRRGFCVFIDTFFQGAVPSVYDDEKVVVFATEIEAQREIADFAMTRLQEFMDGERDFEDAIAVDEYVVEVDVLPDGSVIDGCGNYFGVNPM